MKEYNPNEIEPKWQKEWEKAEIYKTPEDSAKPHPSHKATESKAKCYVLDTFPYPSGEGLHVGHPKGYIGADIYARYKKLTGHNILRPMGWDAFGLPAENYALKNKVHPRVAVEKNIKRFKEQLLKIGFSYDWEREINTTDPAYYKWTQWIFLQLFKEGLAYESHEPINWCPSCKTGLALEDLDGGKCERCGSDVEKKLLRQWVLKIREYADRLLADVEKLDWPESVKEAQRNWIGRSEGAEFEFPLYDIPGQTDETHKVKVFTTRPDTLYGATFIAISADLAKKWLEVGWKASEEVKAFIEKTAQEELHRTPDDVPEKDGIFTGIYAKNPANGEKIAVWVTNYVLSGYGTSAIMAVPAHDERDFQFAKKFNLPITMVACPDAPKPVCKVLDEAYLGAGRMVGSGEFDGMESEEAKWKIADKFGERRVDYKLRDWVFSRQRYWGEPIPIIHCEKCGAVPVPEEELPVVLPEVKNYEPTGTGESPLANIAEWVNVKCPKCGGAGKRETNTMPQWAGSSWYYLAYEMHPELFPKSNTKGQWSTVLEKKWSPVDLYVIGAEHSARHLIYARFWHKFLFDIGKVAYDEPFAKLRNQGLIAGEDGRKMSKRWGNVINPDDVIAQFGADTLRVYEMFMGPFEDGIAWSTDAIVGPRRFLERVWRLQSRITNHISQDTNRKIENLLHKTIKKVSDDILNLKFNTAISALMIFVNELEKEKELSAGTYKSLLVLLAPFAPHIAEELWHETEEQGFIYEAAWPAYDEKKAADEEMNIVVQVDGKVRDIFPVAAGISEEAIKTEAQNREKIRETINGRKIEKVFYVPGRLVSIVTRA